MNKTLETNREMKDSGIEWMEEIPKEWEIIKFKKIISKSNSGEVIPKEFWGSGCELLYTCAKEPLLSNFDQFPQQKRTVLNDLLLTRNGTPYIQIPAPNSIYSNVVQRVSVKNSYPKFIVYSLTKASSNMIGNGDIIESFNMEKWKELTLPLPPLHEQQAIANYLDEQVGKIDELISEQKQAIEQWKAYKQSLITETVTKGLNPDVEMKDSGIEWIGEIPKDWKVSRIKYEFVCLDHKRKPISAENRSVENNVFDYYGASGVIDKVNDFIFDETLLLISEDGANLVMRNLPLVYIASGKYWVNNHAHVLKPNSYNDLKYMFYLLEAGDYNPYITGSAQPKLSQNKLLSYKIVVPPLQEQQAISDYLDGKCLKIDQTIEQKQQLIKQLEEYKQSLIYECVTGKRRVL